MKKKTAIIVNGRIRMSRSFLNIVEILSPYADIFYATDAECINEAELLSKEFNADGIIMEYKRTLAKKQEECENKGLLQWIKYESAIEIMRKVEKKAKINYKYVVKLRSDYIYARPDRLKDLIKNSEFKKDEIISDSDRVFAGERDNMVVYRRFYDIARTMYVNRLNYYYPLNVRTIRESDWDAHCWHAYNMDTRVCNPTNKTEIYKYFIQKQESQEDDSNLPPNISQIKSLHGGNKVFPAERSFSHFTTTMGLRFKYHEGINGIITRETLNI